MANDINTVLVPIEPIGAADNLRISVVYCKGGYNGFRDVYEERGVYVFLVPVEYNNGIYAQTIGMGTLRSGLKVLAKGTARRNAKTEEKVWNAVKDHAVDIAKAFRASRFTEACDIVISLTKNI